MIELVEEGFVQCLFGKDFDDLNELKKSIADAKPKQQLFLESDYNKSFLDSISEVCAFLPRKFLQTTVCAISRSYATVVMTRMRASAPLHVLRRVDLHFEQAIMDDADEKPDVHVAFSARVERVGKEYENHEYIYPLERLMESASVCGVPPYFRICEVRVRGYPCLATPNTIHWMNKMVGMLCRMKPAWNLDINRLDRDYSFPSKAVIDRGSYFLLQNMLIHVIFTAEVDIIMSNNADMRFFLRDIFHYPAIGVTCKTLRLRVFDHRTIGPQFRDVQSTFYMLGWLREPIDKHYPNVEEEEDENKEKKETDEAESMSKSKANSKKTVTSLTANFKSSVTGGKKSGVAGSSKMPPPLSKEEVDCEKVENCMEVWEKRRALGVMVGTLPDEYEDIKKFEDTLIKELLHWSGKPFYEHNNNNDLLMAKVNKVREVSLSHGNHTLYRMTQEWEGKRDYLCVETVTETASEEGESITWNYYRVLPFEPTLRTVDAMAFLKGIANK